MIDLLFVGQLLGFLSFGLGMATFYQKDDKQLKILMVVFNINHLIHYFLLGSLVSVVASALSASRTLESKLVAWAFIVAAVVFGWAGELNVRYIFEKAFTGASGEGYPVERVVPQQHNAAILNDVKAAVCKDVVASLKAIDQDLVKQAVGSVQFQECFFANCQVTEIAEYVRTLIARLRHTLSMCSLSRFKVSSLIRFASFW